MQPIKTDPDIMHGTPCFAGTRVPVDSMFDYLKRGYPVDYFLAQFPSVKREQVEDVLEMSRHAITQEVRAAG
jgi:uncharacterized protein (DUF433 family)